MIGDHFTAWKPTDPGEASIRNTCRNFINGWLQSWLNDTISCSCAHSASIEWVNLPNGWRPIAPMLDVRNNLPYSVWPRSNVESFCRLQAFSFLKCSS